MITDSELTTLWAEITAAQAIAVVKSQGSKLEIRSAAATIQIPRISTVSSTSSIRKR